MSSSTNNSAARASVSTLNKADLVRKFFPTCVWAKKNTKYVNCNADDEESTLYSVCGVCATEGRNPVYRCVTTSNNDEKTLFRNVTTALAHLQKHGLTVENNVYTSKIANEDQRSRIPSDTEVWEFVKVCTEQGIGYNLFNNPKFSGFLRAKLSAHLVRKVVVAAANGSLRQMGAALSNAGGYVSLVCDLGTVDQIQTLNVLVGHPLIKKTYLISSERVPTDISAVELCKMLRNSMRQYRKYSTVPVGAIITDNGANMLKACELLRSGGSMERPSQNKHAQILFFNCSCHVMNLISKTVDEIFASELRTGAHEAVLAKEGLLRRIVPTRWYCRYEEYCRFLSSTVLRDTLAQSTSEHKASSIVADMKSYKTRTECLAVLGRVFERDSSTAAVAITGVLELINQEEPLNPLRPKDSVIQMAALNRYLKWYAPNEVPLLYATLSAKVLISFPCASLFGNDDAPPSISGAEFASLRTFARKFSSEFVATLLPLVNPTGNLETAEAFHLWRTGCLRALEVTRRSNWQDSWTSHWLDAPSTYECLRELHRKLVRILASEAAAERSFSRQKMIRAKRFRLHPSRCASELRLAFNDIEVRARAQSATSPQPRPPLSRAISHEEEERDTEPDSDEEVPTKKRRSEQQVSTRLFQPASQPDNNGVDHFIRRMSELSVGTVTALSEKHGHQVLMMWYWRKYIWDRLNVGDEGKYLALRHRSSYTSFKLKAINRRSNFIVIHVARAGGGVFYKMDMGTAFLRQVQVPTKSLFEWSLSKHRVQVDDDNMQEVEYNCDMDRYTNCVHESSDSEEDNGFIESENEEEPDSGVDSDTETCEAGGDDQEDGTVEGENDVDSDA